MNQKLTVFAVSLAASLVSADAIASQESPSVAVYQIQKQSATHFSATSELLSENFEAFCNGKLERSELEQSWKDTIHAWMYLQGQERGPEVALEKSWSIQFWPDKKNTTGRKMIQLLRQETPVTSEVIGNSSVTVQGIGAIEWLLFDTQSPIKENKELVCSTGQAISINLANNANAINEAWSENPWAEVNTKQWHSEYLALLSNQLDYSMKKMSRPMAKLANPKPYFSESWRSQMSMANLKFNIVSLEKVYLGNGNGLDAILRELGHAQVADSIKNQFATMKQTWTDEQSLFKLLKSKEGYREVLAHYNKFEYLNYLIHEEAAIALGVVVGFNATDGD
ncbi:imelysin family protein [Vibrio sp. HN007]|uniref:imelysin family protein n=1 Tax=Vibrio iocasae TaxID=3098914 RepID=UPI0035D40486